MYKRFNVLIERNTLTAFDYYEGLIDFIDVNYETDYTKSLMNDEIQNMFHDIKYDKDYETVERIYDIACQKYPLVKDHKYLDPKLKHVNSYRVFETVFNNMFEKSKGFQDTTTDDIRKQLINEFPECKDFITLELSDNIPDDYDDIWLIPQKVLLKESYRSLYIKLLEMFEQ